MLGRMNSYIELDSESLTHRGESNFGGICVCSALFCHGLPCGSDGEVSACNVRDPGLNPGSRRFLGEGNGKPLQYSCLENSVDRGA